jgi:regulatory protein
VPFNSKKYKKRFSKDEASALAEKFCAYQERCHKEVRTRLFEYGLASEDVEEVMMDLIQHGFLNEERFARSYARGKFRTKKWGRVKITRELKSRDISPYLLHFFSFRQWADT